MIMSTMVQMNRQYPTAEALAALGLPTGSGSVPEVGVQRRNMADTLFKAVAGCRFSKVRFLFDNGGSRNLTNDRGQNLLVTALHIEDEDRREKMFRYLLKKGVDCCQIDNLTGRDVLSWACILGRYIQVNQLMDAAKGELDFTTTDNQGMSPLHHATIQGHLEVVRLLISVMKKYHLSVDTADQYGLTPFIYAKRLGYFAVADALLREGHCSPKQFDSSVHRSVDDWIQIGIKERQSFVKQRNRELMARYKIQGKAPSKIRRDNLSSFRFKLPAIMLTDSGTGSVQSILESDTRTSETSEESAPQLAIIHETHSKENAVHENKFSTTNGSIQNIGAHHHRQPASVLGSQPAASMSLPPISETRLMSPGSVMHNLQNKSLDTAFALLGIQAKQSAEITHAANFVHSETDMSKASEFSGGAGNLSSMMDILSEQQTDAFRIVAKPPPPPPLPSPPPKRKNVSTLAILFGKDKKPKHYRQSANSRNKTRSVSGQHTQTKKRRTTAKRK